MNFTRRQFLTTGSLALATAAAPVRLFASGQRRPRAAVFYEPGFPAGEIRLEKKTISDALSDWEVRFLNLQELQTALDPATIDVIIHPYGSNFPKDAWTSLYNYLMAGGNWVNIGGIPFSIPVHKDSHGWKVEERQTQYHKKLGITQAFPVSAKEISSYTKTGPALNSPDAIARISADEIYELYVRLTDSIDAPTESGSAGPRDAILEPLVHGLTAGKRHIAAPLVLIDRLQGKFSGGRWILANFKGSLSSGTLKALAEFAIHGSIRLSAKTSFACYCEGEQPSISINCTIPKGTIRQFLSGHALIEVADDRGNRIESSSHPLTGTGATAAATVSLAKRISKPGLYHVRVRQEVRSLTDERKFELSCATGFWISDDALLARGKRFSVDENYLLHDGEPYVVTGTTYMGSDVHRKFLFEPNPSLWDHDFGEMKSAGINMVRTGIWTGWKQYMPDAGSINESAFRALDAFILTARKHDVPVIFTFFAFLPEMWGGVNAYLDPRSIDAQKTFVASIVQRYRAVNDIIWDTINEPSFCNPQYLWSCRPNYDEHENQAWVSWLKERYPDTPEETTLSRLQSIYRSTPAEAFALPKIEEFNDVNIFDENRPVKVIDYRLFAQEMFARWVKQIAAAIRENGNPGQLVTVGQDEAGTGDSPNQHFFGDAVDFSCVHNWWLNDDLVWDNVMTKAPGKANLVEETGIMFYEKMDGGGWRTEEEVRNLLERKLAISIGAGGAGFIEWIWNANPYMKSDNEAAIGLFRVDGTAKPELEPVMQFAKFFAANRHRMKGRKEEDVVMVIPHSQMYSTRNFATEATQRCVKAMYNHCNMTMKSVSEYQVASLTTVPKLILVPSPNTLNQTAWQTIVRLYQNGSTVLISGPIDRDDHWLPVNRSKVFNVKAANKPVSQREFLSVDGVEYSLSFRGDKLQRLEKAVTDKEGLIEMFVIDTSLGKMIWSPLPIELAEEIEPTVALYTYALGRAGITSVFSNEDKNSSVLIIPTVFEDVVLYTLISETNRDANVQITHRETQTILKCFVPAQRTELMFINRSNGKILSTLSQLKGN